MIKLSQNIRILLKDYREKSLDKKEQILRVKHLYKMECSKFWNYEYRSKAICMKDLEVLRRYLKMIKG